MNFASNNDAALKQKQDSQQTVDNAATQAAMVQAIISQIHIATERILANQPKVTVNNPVDTVSTPDVAKVVAEIGQLRQDVTDGKLTSKDGLDRLCEALKAIPGQIKIPESHRTVSVDNLHDPVDHSADLAAIRKAIEDQKLSPVFDPKITVKPSDVKVVNEYGAILDKLGEVVAAVSAIDIPTPEPVDNSTVIKALKAVEKAVKSIPVPVAGTASVGPSFKNSDGSAARARVNDDGYLLTTGVQVTERYDYSTPPVYYVGSATPGSATSSDTWTINKFDLTDISDAQGLMAIGVAWDDRVGATYV